MSYLLVTSDVLLQYPNKCLYSFWRLTIFLLVNMKLVNMKQLPISPWPHIGHQQNDALTCFLLNLWCYGFLLLSSRQLHSELVISEIPIHVKEISALEPVSSWAFRKNVDISFCITSIVLWNWLFLLPRWAWVIRSDLGICIWSDKLHDSRSLAILIFMLIGL